jgi:hypothetical protein
LTESQREVSYLKESGKTNLSNLNNNNNNYEVQDQQQIISFFEVFHEYDQINLEQNPNREFEWVILEPSHTINSNLINAFLDYEL